MGTLVTQGGQVVFMVMCALACRAGDPRALLAYSLATKASGEAPCMHLVHACIGSCDAGIPCMHASHACLLRVKCTEARAAVMQHAMW